MVQYGLSDDLIFPWVVTYIYILNIYLFISSCQYLISGLKEISLHQLNAEYAMKYVEVKGGSRDSDVFGVI